MKELIINIPEDAVEFVEEFAERIGGTISDGKKRSGDKEKLMKVKPLDFFGSWPDITFDPETYRKNLWRKTQQL